MLYECIIFLWQHNYFSLHSLREAYIKPVYVFFSNLCMPYAMFISMTSVDHKVI